MYSREQSEKDLAQAREAIAEANGRIESLLRDYLTALAALCARYRTLGVHFSLSASQDLISASQDLAEAFSGNMQFLFADVVRRVTAVTQGEYNADVQDVLSSFADAVDVVIADVQSRFEGIAGSVMLSGGSAADAVSEYMSHMSSAAPSPSVREAMRTAAAAVFIQQMWSSAVGRGHYLSPVQSLRRLVQSDAMGLYQRNTLARMVSGGARYYRTFRCSSYDCPACDEVAARIHPVTEQVLPVHPWCVCGMYEIDPITLL